MDKIRRQKEIDTFKAGAAGARSMLKTLGPTSDPALKDKYSAQAANYEEKARQLEAILNGEEPETAPAARAPGSAWSYTRDGKLQILQR
jgi:hypothetical protein